MKEVVEELIKNLISSIWFRIFLFILILLMSGVLYFVVKTPDVKKGTVVDENEMINIQEDVNQFYSKEDEGIPEESNDNPNTMNAKDTIENLIIKYFSYAQLGEVDLFPSTIVGERFESDFFKFDFTERDEEIKRALEGITRKQQLESVKVIRNLWVMKANSSRVVIDLYYKDLKEPIRVNLLIRKVKQIEGHHSEANMDMYFVDTSIWELIESIENKEGE
ncbi:hypothetical protein [Viridibacillus arvi]|uniref:hypothetical protein n=1 Tax=Viridibacillus arvi TaxID=263475 RepID=UPI0034CEC102